MSPFKKGRVVWSVILAVFVGIVISARSLAGFYVDVLWHDVLGRTDVFWGILSTKITLAILFVMIFAFAMVLNLWVADR